MHISIYNTPQILRVLASIYIILYIETSFHICKELVTERGSLVGSQ